MSLSVVVHFHNGIVFASDSRSTFTYTERKGHKIIKQEGIYVSDCATKIFLANDYIGISAVGQAIIDKIPINIHINNYIKEHINPYTDIELVPKSILRYFRNFNKVPDITFLIAGLKQNQDIWERRVYEVRVASSSINKIDTSVSGATWIGEGNVLSKIIQETYTKNSDGLYTKIPHYSIPWDYFNLQDSIDFAKFAIDVTMRTIRFQLKPETVGGYTDVLVIQPDGAYWEQKKTNNFKPVFLV